MSNDSREEYKLVQSKLKEMKPLFARMDEDEGLYLLKPFKMKKLGSSDDEKDVSNVTLNDPLLYAKKAIAITGSYQRQTVIEGKDLTDKQTTKIEEFLDDVFYMVNELLPNRGIPSLEAFINEQACIRGRIGARSAIELDGEGSIIPDVMPVDTRWFPLETGTDGMMWGAPICSRSKTQIEREYPDFKTQLKDTGNKVIDFWNAEKELVFIEEKFAQEEVNSYKYPPFVIAKCPIGCMFNTEDAMKHDGESIFWPNRNLWKEKNETTTILKTLSRKALKGGLELQVTDPKQATKPELSPFQEDVVIPTEKGGGFRQLPVNDIKSATRLLYSIIETCLQRGELTPLDYGTLAFPLSSVAILNLIAARNDIFAPILSMIASFYQGLSRMIIGQCVQFDQTIKLGRPEGYNTYSPSDFAGEYSIKYHFFLITKEQTAADLSIANAARGFLPDNYILREVLKAQNPDGLEIELKSQQAEQTDEVLFLYRRARSLVDRDKPTLEEQIEAYILTERIKTILKQRRNLGSLSPMEGKREEEATPEGLLPMFTKGGGQGGIKTPKPEEVEGE
ncbi:hypothetical protein ES707_01301 [subsurface metagenome]